ncbi:hypothetical protein MBLNU459_g0798t1 [Dothideomycetes sp. NU459]
MSDAGLMWDKLECIFQANGLNGDDEAAQVLADYGTPSTSIAVLEHGQISSRCFSRVGDNAETVFQACSISKPVTAMAVMRLVSRNKLSLDVPIHTYLPERIIQTLSTSQTHDLLQHVTIKHLLSHTSGLTVHGFAGYPEDDIPDAESVLAGRPPANSLQVRLESLPGLRFAYSGGGFTVLQLILEQVTRKSFPDLMQELVFTPLDMKRSFYRKPNRDDNHASVYYTGWQECEVPFHVLPEQAAAGLWTTPTDLLKVAYALQRSLVDENGLGFISQDLARRMLDEVSDGMALAWFAPRDPGTAFQHGGSNFGFRCHILGWARLKSRTPDDRSEATDESGVCVMTNSEQGTAALMKTMLAVAYLKGWPVMPLVYGLRQAMIPFRALDAAPLQDHWKQWKGRWGGHWNLVEVEGCPYVCFQQLPPVKLLPAAYPAGPSEVGLPIDLVMMGLEIMLRLTYQEKELVVEVWHGPKGDVKVVHRE